jgi:acetyl-CoA synthetase
MQFRGNVILSALLVNQAFAFSPPNASFLNRHTHTSATTCTATTALSTAKDHDHAEAAVFDAITSNTAFESYKSKHAESISDPSAFWAKEASRLTWYQEPPSDQPALHGGFEAGDVKFFPGGKLNVCYNAIDRHALSNGGKGGEEIAMIWEGDEPTDTLQFTYNQMLEKVSKIANALKNQGVKKGDVVTIYMPMIPELPMTMLACARIGAVHSVVFAGFSADALGARVSAAKSEYVITADIGLRGTKQIPLKKIVNDAITKLDCEELVKSVMVYERFYNEEDEDAPYEMKGRDVRMNQLVDLQRPYCVPEVMDAEDELFILYTSGSTGMPKGLVS